MIASLCWYPATRPVWDRLWQGIRAHLGWGPDTLVWPDSFATHWRDRDLVLGMTCALPMQMGLSDDVTVVGSPVWDVPDMQPGHYASVLVTRSDDPRDLTQAAAAGLAVNAPDSQSGWGTLRATDLRGPVQVTGSHAASMDAVARGQAHLAAIDRITWMMAPHPDLTVRRITPPTPSTPFITARPDWRVPVRQALEAAIAEMRNEDRAATRLIGVTDLQASAYAVPQANPA
ncbi:MAG: PhnD/SsuA/transferrin family substrate-binding protein [Pseudomonadota bacterium]